MKIQVKRINQLENDKILLEKQVLKLKKENITNRVASEENEQYGRRLCLRIDGIPTEKRKSSENVLHHSHKKRKDSLETRVEPTVFAL